MKVSALWPLLLIFIFGFLLRIYNIDSFPPSLNWDETSIGYNAFSISKQGMDEWGNKFPLIFKAFGDYKLPAYIYLTAFFYSLFGISIFTLKLASILSGSLTVVLAYFIYNKISPDKKFALIAALLVAVEPWTFFISRIAVEANVGVLLFTLGITFFLYSFNFFGILSFILSMYAYNSFRICIPALAIVYFLFNYPKLRNIRSFISARILIQFVVCLILLIPLVSQFGNTDALKRYRWTQILDQGAINRINELRNSSQLPSPLPKLVYNKATFLSFTFVGNYLSYLNPKFLFLNGGNHYQFSVPGHGLLYLVNLPFFVFGLANLHKNKLFFPLLIWLLVSPLAGSLTKDSPHSLRFVSLLPLPMLVTSYGLEKLSKSFLQSRFVYIYIISLFISMLLYSNKANNYLIQYSWAWQYPYQPMVRFIRDHPEYKSIIITKKYGEPHIFVLFDKQVLPSDYINDPNLIRYHQSDWNWVDRYSNYWFLNDWDIKNLITERDILVELNKPALLVTTPNNYPEGGWKKIEQIKHLDGSVAFDILELTE